MSSVVESSGAVVAAVDAALLLDRLVSASSSDDVHSSTWCRPCRLALSTPPRSAPNLEVITALLADYRSGSYQ
jgi:hypothetical protein